MRLLVAALLATAVLAGCVGSTTESSTTPPPPAVELSPKQYAILPAEEVWVDSPQDGVRLHNAVFRPDTDGKVPVFINFSPYWGDTAMDGGDAFARYMIDEYVPRGFAVVLSAVRGTGHSGGCFQIGGDVELRDAYDVVDHFAKESWSSGSIAAGGKSYDATTQNGMVAKFPHPALKGLFHVSGITDVYAYNYRAGVPYSNGLEFTPRYFVTEGLDEYLSGTPGAEDPESLSRIVEDAACPEFPKHVASGEGSAAHGLKDAYWTERDWAPFLRGSEWNGTVFFVHGLQDWNVKPDHTDPWLQVLQEKGIRVLGWLHQWQQDGTGHVYPMRTDWNRTMLAWLDSTLKGKDVPVPWGFEVQGTDGTWRRSAAWPPQPAGAVEAAATPPSGGLPAGTGLTVAQLEPFDGDTRIAGTPTARVTVTPTTADPIVRLALYTDIGGKRTWAGEAVRRLQLSDDLTEPRPVVTGMPVTVNVTFYPVDLWMPAGSRLLVEMGAGPAPQGEDTPANFVFLPQQVTGVAYGALTLSFPMVASEPVEPQPEPMRCFTC